MLIFVSGSVGAGKSTLAKNLTEYLSAKEQVHCHRMEAFPLFSYLTYNLLSMLLYGRDLVKSHNNVNIHPATLLKKRLGKIPSPVIYFLCLIEVVSVFLKYTELRVKCSRKRYLIIEDGFINMMANYLEIFETQAKWMFPFIRSLIGSFERRTSMKTVYLYLDSSRASIERWHIRGHPVSTALVNFAYLVKYDSYIESSKKIYKQMGYQVLELNTRQLNPESTCSLVIRELGL
jgi:hypothetical protein